MTGEKRGRSTPKDDGRTGGIRSTGKAEKYFIDKGLKIWYI
jgi:hypothetical protein